MKRANANLEAEDLPPPPEDLAPNGLHRTFARVSYGPGESPPVMRAEVGHTNPYLALRVLGGDEQGHLRALVGREEAYRGTRGEIVPIERARARTV